MSDRAWRVDELEQEAREATASPLSLVTMNFLTAALRRRWAVWIGLGLTGMLLGLAWVVTAPPASVGTVTLLLAHDPSANPQEAQSTDLSLLRTRTLAADVVDRIGLQMSPEEFQQSVVSAPASSEVLVLEVSGPDDTAAVARARTLAEAYLAFRTSQFQSQLEALTVGYEKRIDAVRQQIKELSSQYAATRANSPGDEQQLSALLTKQAQLATEMQSARQSIDDARLKNDSVVNSSYVLDTASLKPPPSEVKVVALAMTTGLVGATAMGIGLVLAAAITSNRLRRREEVAQALDTPVRISVGRRRRWWPSQRVRLSPAALATLVDALEREVSRRATSWPPTQTASPRNERMPTSRLTHLALATVDTAEVGALVMAHLAARLSVNGLDVFVADLSESGGLAAALERALGENEGPDTRRRPVVHRPDRVPSLTNGPLEAETNHAPDSHSTEPWRAGWEQADVSLALAELDPAVGAEHLKLWADEVVVLVAAGRSSAERLRTTGELIRTAGLRLLFAMLIGTDRTDESPGLGDRHPGWRRPGRTAAAPGPAPGGSSP